METDATRMCELLVGLGDVDVLGVRPCLASVGCPEDSGQWVIDNIH